ncbi:MAG: lipoprotein [Proteobacteria bacterium]|jgi:predicted small lipoprotein YifL|nr:lipoprotein [Pseudomonadota bacterium]MDA1351507.1 lipoprotein [Pseudomonadota bacterium]
MNYTRTVYLLLTLMLLALGGCGNTGDLYLPEDASETLTSDNQQTES